LEAVLLQEGFLNGMELPFLCQPLDGHEARAVGLYGQHEARTYAQAVQKDRAGAAHSMLAADVRTPQSELSAQEVHQRGPRLDERLVGHSINGQANLSRRSHPE
jgi:hypothetical protein